MRCRKCVACALHAAGREDGKRGEINGLEILVMDHVGEVICWRRIAGVEPVAWSGRALCEED